MVRKNMEETERKIGEAVRKEMENVFDITTY